MEKAMILSYKVHNVWVKTLFKHYFRPPYPGYSSVTLEQLNRADHELFLLAGQECRDGIRPLPDGSLPLDEAFKKLMNDPRVSYFVLPLPAKASSSKPSDSAPTFTGNSSVGGDPRAPKVRKEFGGEPKAGAKGNSKGKYNKSKRPLPDELRNMKMKTSKGNPICQNYNLSKGCHFAPPGGSCKFGVHMCCSPACKHPTKHSLNTCDCN